MAAGSSISEVASDNNYSQKCLTIQSGQSYRLTLNNKGLAVHNLHVTNVKGTDGKDIATPLTDPGKTSSLTFSIAKPGTYSFRCDVHPAEMIGTLTVT
ncbi:MAG: cupredoxin domain-containing protein [Dehalococcoidia bacterium]